MANENTGLKMEGVISSFNVEFQFDETQAKEYNIAPKELVFAFIRIFNAKKLQLNGVDIRAVKNNNI